MEQHPENTIEANLPLMEFNKLVSSIQNTHEELHLSAVKAINQSLTVRNWLIGFYIVEFEQKVKIEQSMVIGYLLSYPVLSK